MPSEHLWWERGLIKNVNSPLLPSCWGFSFALGHGVSPHSHFSTYSLTGVPLTWTYVISSWLAQQSTDAAPDLRHEVCPFSHLLLQGHAGKEHRSTHQQKIRLKINWIQLSSLAQSCPTLCNSMDCSTPGLPISNSWSLLKLMSIELVMPSNHLILCCPLLLLPSIFPSIRVFSNESVFASGGQSIGVSTSASVLPMNIHDWFPLGQTGWNSLLSKGS